MGTGFEGKVALVTGGSVGIGLAVGELLSKHGAHVWLVARREEILRSALLNVKRVCKSSEQRCGIIPADVTDYSQASSAVDVVAKSCGAPDLLINCTGDVYTGPFNEMMVDVARDLMEVNYFAAVNMVKACLPAMIARRSGQIVNVSSVYGFLGMCEYSAYCASKFAIRGFSDSLRAELKPFGIKVSIVFPQNTATPQLERENAMKSATIKALDDTKVMTPEDAAAAIIRGISRGQYVIMPGAQGKFLHLLTRVLGNSGTYWILDRMIADAKKKAAGAGK